MWGPTWVDDAVPEKKINIEKILLRYPDIVKAHVDKGRIIVMMICV